MPLRIIWSVVLLLFLAAAPQALASTESRLEELEKRAVEIGLMREALAEQTAILSRLQDELDQLKGAFEELRHGLTSLEQLEQRLNQSAHKIATPAAALPSAKDALAAGLSQLVAQHKQAAQESSESLRKLSGEASEAISAYTLELDEVRVRLRASVERIEAIVREIEENQKRRDESEAPTNNETGQAEPEGR